jgi:hypothetical protein
MVISRPGRWRGGEAALDPHRLLGEPAEELSGVGDLRLGLGERLAHLERHQQRELVRALVDLLPRAAQDLTALARRVGRPLGLRRGAGVERRPRVLRRRVGDLGERLAGRGVLDRERRAAARVAPLAADVQPASGPPRRLPAPALR